MSRDPVHGGGAGWGFGEALWSPTRKRAGGKWGYWEAMRRVKAGDQVIHLRGKADAHFVGSSIADADCYITSERPPEPRAWSHANQFYRVPLCEYVEFKRKVRLADILAAQEQALTAYHHAHSPASGPNGRLLFFVPQDGRLQCQNGAYLSEIDDVLLELLLGISVTSTPEDTMVVTDTAESLGMLPIRVGQQAFSNAVKKNYGFHCCFPECDIAEQEFLIGSHIARWADAPSMRGRTANGLCLCLMHDKAFERGLFTLDAAHRVVLHPTRAATNSWAQQYLLPYKDRPLKQCTTPPCVEALQHHWERIRFAPATAANV